MGGPEVTTTEPAAAPGPDRRNSGPAARWLRTDGRRPWWVWVAPFALVLVVLVIRSRFLFSVRFYEDSDTAANSILIEQAKHFTLLVGNYSRERFNHPGPAYMYVQAFGEWLFLDALRLVPTAWNAHVLAVFALNSAFVAMVVAVVYGWTRSVRGALVSLAVILGFVSTEPFILSFDWMPWMYVPTYIAFIIAAGSVAAGGRRDVWILTLTGWFLIHGHAAFLFFVPVIVGSVLLAVVVRYGLRAPLRAFARPRTWVPVTVISAVFALPIVVNLVLHWPGDFGEYFSYSSSGQAGGHTAAQVVRYALWYWWKRGPVWAAALVPAVAYLVAIIAVAVATRGPLRRFLATLLAVNVVSTAAFLCYVAVGVDFLQQDYIGYFYFSAPVITLLVIAVAVVHAPPVPLGAVVAAGAAVLGVAAFAAAPGTAVPTSQVEPGLPAAVSAVAARAHGKTIVIYLDHNAWQDVTGFLVQAERTGVRACVQDPWWTFMMTSQFICTSAQVGAGAPFWFHSPAAPPGVPVVATLEYSAITAGAPS
jgi:hypothetical protein